MNIVTFTPPRFKEWVANQQECGNLYDDNTSGYVEGPVDQHVYNAFIQSGYSLDRWAEAWNTAANYIRAIGLKPGEDIPYVVLLTGVLLSFASESQGNE